MKKNSFIALIICFAILGIMLTGCSDPAGVDDYEWQPEVVVKLEYDLYIITDSIPTEQSIHAQKTVNSKINQYLDDKFNTILNIRYFTAEEYDTAINEITGAGSRAATTTSDRYKAGTILLITSDEMHDELVNANKLVDLRPFLDTKDFGTLNIQITSTLIEAATVTVDDVQHLYCIPNDHIIGEYEYTLINREIAEGKLNFSAQTEILDMLLVDGIPNDEAQALIDSLNENAEILGDLEISDVIRNEKGSYEDKARFEAEGYICNVSKYPEATREDAFNSAFGILKANDIYEGENLVISAADCEKRAMQIVYSINADKTVRNLLQYGVEHTHYILEGNVAVPTEENAYHMNLLYTGDMFNAYYSSAWTENMAKNGEIQNSQSVVLGK